jgi:putative FmdB family regulatory protein
MPIYIFKCPNGHVFEENLPISLDTDTIECDKCTLTAKKVPAIGGFSLKGDGWPGKDLKMKK